MQSFVEYRKLGERVRRQLGAKSQNAETAHRENRRLDLSSSSAQPEDAEKDVEKGSSSGDEEREDVEQPEPAEEVAEAVPTESLGGHDLAALGTTVSRVSTAKSTRSQGTRLGHAMTGVNVRDRTEDEGGDTTKQVFVVGYQGPDDPMDPHNWSTWTRVGCTAIIALIGGIVGFASSIDSSVLRNASEEFHVSTVTESLATGIFLIGFGIGGLLSGPISEAIGRNPVYIATLTLYMIFIMASALAPNIGAQLAFRFIAGVFGSTPLTCAGGSIADMWDPLERVYSFPIFANAAFMGPIIGPVVGGFVADPSSLVGWRWTEWITLIISGLVLALVVLFQPETYTPILLKWKAEHLRKETGDDRFVAPIEVRAESFGRRLLVALYRPFLLTATEIIVIAIALYLTVIYVSFENVQLSPSTDPLTPLPDRTVHLPRRLRLHLRHDRRHPQPPPETDRAVLPGHRDRPVSRVGNRAAHLLLGEARPGGDQRGGRRPAAARVPAVVRDARRLGRDPGVAVLDGLDE